jgi:putative Ca2+/H+ antiporter (TMEM165/GDT1 family)
MDALMAALVVAALAGIGDRPAWLAAILADRYHRPGLVIVAATLALAGASGIAALLGATLGPRFTPEAKLLMLALALLLQGGGGLWPVKPPDRLDGWRIGTFATALLGLFILVVGDGVQFIVATLAARSPLPWLAAVGAAAGTLVVVVPAVLLGERGWTGLPLPAARRVIAALFLLAGAVLAMQAFALI